MTINPFVYSSTKLAPIANAKDEKTNVDSVRLSGYYCSRIDETRQNEEGNTYIYSVAAKFYHMVMLD